MEIPLLILWIGALVWVLGTMLRTWWQIDLPSINLTALGRLPKRKQRAPINRVQPDWMKRAGWRVRKALGRDVR